MSDTVRYRVTLLDPFGQPLFQAHAEEDRDYDPYRVLVGDARSARCVLDSPEQADRRATYSLLVEALAP